MPEMKRAISLTVVLAAVWLAWSGHLDSPLLLSLGAASVVFVVLLCAQMGILDGEAAPLELSFPRLFAYVPWLAREIVLANLDVARRIVTPGPVRIAPRLVRVRASQRTDVARVIHANSITLTPGTISIDVEGDEILVHALHAAAADGVESGAIDRRCTALERSAP